MARSTAWMTWLAEPSVAFHRRDVVEPADATGDVARRRALERRDHADDVAVALRGDVHDPQRGRVDLVDGGQGGLRHRLAEDLVAGDHDEADGMDRRGRARREDGSLHATLAPVGEEHPDVGEAAELGSVHRRLGPGRQRLPTWAMTSPMWSGATCTHGHRSTLKIGHSLNRRPGINRSAWYPASPLIAMSWSIAELASDALGDETDLGRAHRMEALTHADQDHQHHDHDDQDPDHVDSSLPDSSGMCSNAEIVCRLDRRWFVTIARRRHPGRRPGRIRGGGDPF